MKFFAFVKPLSLTFALLLPSVSLFSAPDGNADDPPKPVRLPEESKVAFLGLLATKLSPVVGRQLGLPANLYLTVAMVSPDGPSEKAGLKQYDILKKLDDQILINPEQLVELVGSKKIGQEVSLSILRGGEEKTLKVKLGAKKRLGIAGPFNRIQRFERPSFPDAQAWEERILNQLDRTLRPFGQRGLNLEPLSSEIIEKFDADGDGRLSRLERDKAVDEGAISGKRFDFGPNLDLRPAPDFQKMIKEARKRGAISSWSSVSGSVKTKIVNSDDDGTYEYTSEDGDKHFKVTSVDGEVLFEGPVNTDDQRTAIPEALLDHLESLEGSVRINIDQFGQDSKLGNKRKKNSL